VNGTAIGAHTNLDELLDHKIGTRVVLGLAEGDEKREVVVRPISTTAEKNLVYRQWAEQQRAYVAKVSGGRLGYVHIIDMSSEALDQLYLDLDTENRGREGVVVDIRNNNGGFVNGLAIDVLARRSYLKMADRNEEAAGGRMVLGQRALERPTILVVNRHSLSDAEDFTEGYRALKLGKVVGEPTAGWIIYTSGTRLIDGTTLRLPGTRITR
jgi:C-terminal processing protease CtpA/Prc